ncbi:MAG: cupin domain-containing protein [Haloarculaceae archaeon]
MSDDLASVDPHVVRKGAKETGGDFVRFESTMHPALDADDGDVDLPYNRWGIDFTARHVHPKQKERIEVVSGELQVTLADEKRTLTKGDDVTIPANTPHRHWNATARPVRVVWERHPPFQTEEWVESVYAHAQAGKTDEEGTPGWLQQAVFVDAYPNESPYLTSIPVRLQKLLFSILAPVGRLVGAKATYSREEIGEQRDHR